ncbi:hypothetical protein [Xanthomonas oryzae]|nr:hypothetical protein [Xanthomonas oryzae]AJQ85330.1 hypothetical protein AZ54_00075 [Xanthomonas oryzae pv. oryzae PXO86]MDI9071231.1 hypothetical protein [Xanthomonas oryzae pv. oryzae]MDI9101911.1 hypothetical protein [Xanthomonas oryzae pv. oryzae]MDI9910639.1 hypothetical protein [Xanthomonas oryzae pv. oryzae]QQD51636.1 hypothetical protein BXO512_010200 [Xanthomonas oryzae pv. oryzae]
MKAVTLVQQGIETERLMMKMIAMFSSLVLLGFVGNATASVIAPQALHTSTQSIL